MSTSPPTLAGELLALGLCLVSLELFSDLRFRFRPATKPRPVRRANQCANKRDFRQPADFILVIQAAASTDPAARMPWPARDLALAALLAGTAARASEVCGLRIGDVVLDGDEPYVRVLGKGSVTRDCPLTAELVAVLTRYYLATRDMRTGKAARKKDPLFPILASSR